MGKKVRNIICILCFVAFIAALIAAFVIKEPITVLVSERRKAAQFPEFSAEAVMDKSFFDGFEDYLADQFPLRDGFRAVKSAIELKIFGQKDSGGTFIAEGHISEIQADLNEASVKNAAKKINSIYETYLKDNNCRVFYSVIPDKNYYLAEKNGYPSLDYEALNGILESDVKNMEYIDISDCLTLDSFYKTDTHWKQEAILPVAERLAEKMNFALTGEYNQENLGEFNGVYSSRFAFGAEKDKIICLRNNVTDSAKVFNAEKQIGYTGVYDTEKLEGNDKYDVFLSGAVSVITAENPLAKEKKELVMFRDSFGSSLAPLLLEGYSKITLVDTRYIHPMMLGNFVGFENCDVLFIYNTQIFNQSNILK